MTATAPTKGGSFPRWRNPKEIVYIAPDLTLMSVAVTGAGATFAAAVPAPLFKDRRRRRPGGGVRRDGRRQEIHRQRAPAFAGAAVDQRHRQLDRARSPKPAAVDRRRASSCSAHHPTTARSASPAAATAGSPAMPGAETP